MSWPEVKRIRKLLPREEMVPGWGQARVECGVLGGGGAESLAECQEPACLQ